MASIEQAWADKPFDLILIPGSKGRDLSESVFIAREMACAHNGMLRGLNSIYQQAPFVTSPQDISDLLQYTDFWCGWIHEHHELEEGFFFPDIQRIVKGEGEVEEVMAKNVEQHNVFRAGIEELGRFARETRERVEEYDGMKLRGVIDGFGGKLTEHLTDEIQTLLALKEYDGPELKRAWMDFEGKLRNGDKAVLFPIVHDASFEEGLSWPEVPFFVRPLVNLWFERKYKEAWRFNPCSTWGERRPLLFTMKSS